MPRKKKPSPDGPLVGTGPEGRAACISASLSKYTTFLGDSPQICCKTYISRNTVLSYCVYLIKF